MVSLPTAMVEVDNLVDFKYFSSSYALKKKMGDGKGKACFLKKERKLKASTKKKY